MSQRLNSRGESPPPHLSPNGSPDLDGDERLRFEALLSQLSATFIHLPADEVDGQIDRGLQQIVDFLGVDRSSLAQFSADGAELVVTHSWTRPGCAPFPRVNLVPLFPWYTARMRRGELMRFTRLPDELPADAVEEREYCIQSGFRSHLLIPFKVGASVLGGLAIGSFGRENEWPDRLVLQLRLVGEVFANALARKRAEEQHARLRDLLARAGRVTTMGELAASIAHEVNQPLCAIVSNAQALQRMLGGGESALDEVREALEDVADDARRASEVIARVRGFLQKSPAARTPVDVNDLVGEVCLFLRGDLARRGVKVKLELAEGLPAVLGDRVQLQQVVLNRMANAADAVDQVGGAPHEVVVRSTGEGALGVAVEVADAGAGLDPATAGRIFEPFFTTKPGGMGMGLAICKSIVEGHGGAIEARRNAGPGTTLRLTLPVAQGGTT